MLHFPTLISSFDLLFFNFVIPISPAAFYYNFKYYPYWPLKSSEKQTPRVSEVSRELKSLLSLLLCQLQHYGFSWNRCIWVSSKLLKLQWTFHLLTNDMAASTSSSLFDIIVTIIIDVLINVIVISEIIIIINAIGVSYLSCPLLMTLLRETHAQSWVVSHE